KGLGKNRQRPFDRRRHDPNVDQKAAVAVGYRQRINPPLIGCAEPAFKVGTPLVVGCGHRRKWPQLIERAPPTLYRQNQLGLLEDLSNRRCRRPAHLRCLTFELRQQFARPQMWKTPSHRNDLVLQRRFGLVRTMPWRVRAIREPVCSPTLTSSAPLVNRIAANAVSPAQLRYAPIPSVVVRQHPNSLFHPTSLCKRHRQVPLRCKLTCRPSTRAKLSTIYPVRTRPFRTRCSPPPPTPPPHSAPPPARRGTPAPC